METSVSSPVPFLLASVLTSYPDEGFAESIRVLLDDPNANAPDSLRRLIERAIASESALDDLRSDYIDIFDRSKELNPLYETEYGRERAMFKAKELSDIAGFYRAFGFEMGADDGPRDMVDHVAVEFEFYSLMGMKQEHLADAGDHVGVEIVHDARKKFLTDHLGRFVRSIGERPGVRSNEFYREAIDWCASVVDAEVRLMGVRPDTATWFSSQAEKENVCCGETLVTR